MNNLEKILHKIRLCASRNAPPLAGQFFRLLALDQRAVSITQISHPVWENIARLVKAILQSDISPEQRLYLQKLTAIASTKTLQEDTIGHIVTARNLRRAALFSNYNAFRYAALTKKLLSHSSGSEGAVSTADFFKSRLDKSTENKNMLFDAVRFLHRQREQRFFETGKTAYLKTMEFYETLYASMIHNLKQVHHREIFCGFQKCDLCWRLVPSQNSAICRCEIHAPQNPGIAYTRALRIGNFWGKKRAPEALTYLHQKISGMLSPLFKAFYSSEKYYDPVLCQVGSEETRKHFECISSVQYNLTQIWKILSRTRR